MEERHDDFFIIEIRKGNEKYAKLLENEYVIKSHKLASKMYALFKKPGMMEDDFYSIALECYFKALKRYQIGKGCFFTYWRAIVIRESSAYSRSFNNGQPTNTISLDEPISTSKESLTFGEIYGETDIHIIGDCEQHELINEIHENDGLGLDYEEKQVLLLHTRQSIKKIAEIMGVNENRVRYLIKRATNKMRKYHEDK